MTDLTAATFKTDLRLLLRDDRYAAHAYLDQNARGPNPVTADGKRVSSLILDDYTLFQDIKQTYPGWLDIARADAKTRATKPTADTVLNFKSIFAVPYFANSRFEVADGLARIAKNHFFAPEDFVADAGFMADLATQSRIPDIAGPVEDMLRAAIYNAGKKQDGDLIERLGTAVRTGLRRAAHNAAQTEGGGLVETLLRVTATFPDPALRRAVLTDRTLTADHLHAADQIRSSVAIACAALKENANDELLPYLLAGIKQALPPGPRFEGTEQADYLRRLKDATHGKPEARRIVVDLLPGFDAETLIRLACDGTAGSEFTHKLEAAFAGKAKSEQLRGLFAIAYEHHELLSRADEETFSRFAAIAAANPETFDAKLPARAVAENFDAIAANLLDRRPSRPAAANQAAQLLVQTIGGAGISAGLRSKYLSRSFAGAWRMVSNVRANRRALPVLTNELGVMAQARRTLGQWRRGAGQNPGYSKT